MLALMGRNATVYVLTFSDEELPESFAQVRRRWRQFVRDLRGARGGGFDYIYVIEGLHGGARWHIHAVLRDGDFDLQDVERWWSGGMVLDPEPLLQGPWDGFRRTADYFTKERRDGERIPHGTRQWVASPSLYRLLQPPEKKTVRSGSIRLPPGVRQIARAEYDNAFGAYRYRAWIEAP